VTVNSNSVDTNDPLLLPWDGENYVALPGIAGNSLSVPDSAALDVVGDIEIVARVKLADWTPAVANNIVIKGDSASAATYSYDLHVNTSGCLSFQCSDGASFINNVSSTTPVPAADGATVWVKATFDITNGTNAVASYFWAADSPTEPSTWTALDSKTRAIVSGLANSALPLLLGLGAGSTRPLNGNIYRVIVRNGIGGSTVLDIAAATDVANSGATSFVCSTGQTVTVGRATTGRKTVLVTRPVWLFGTDDYLEVADNALLNFGAADSFTVFIAYRDWATRVTGPLFSKAQASATATMTGWTVMDNATPAGSNRFGDGTNRQLASDGQALPAVGNPISRFLIRNVATDQHYSYVRNTQGSVGTDTSTGTLANALNARIGTAGDLTIWKDMEVMAAAIWRRVLTTDEIAAINDFYGTA
jgi:hypothetical protein